MLKGSLLWLLARWKSLVIITVPLVLLPLLTNSGTTEAKCGYVVLLMALYWMTEAVPLAVTSLIPVMLFPLLGVLSTDAVCMNYLKEANMLSVGGMIVALAIEHCDLHKRIALRVLLLIGTSPRLLMLGFMVNTMFLSMWISNTATAALMVPIVQSILEEMRESNLQVARHPGNDLDDGKGQTVPDEGHNNTAVSKVSEASIKDNSVLDVEEQKRIKLEEKKYRKKTICYYLGIAYAANIGGTGTVTGTGTNLIMLGIFNTVFPEGKGLNFATWMIFNVPVMLVNTFLAWVWLQVMYMGLFTRGGCSRDSDSPGDSSAAVRQLIARRHRELGDVTWHQASVLALFVALVLLWFFRQPEFIPGWADLLPAVEILDSTPAMCIVFLLFALPANLDFLSRGPKGLKPTPSLLKWNVVHEKLPWGVVLLLGGAYAMADATQVSGLSAWLGEQLEVLDVLPEMAVVAIVCLMSTFLTEVCSNSAVANILLPVLAEMSKVLRIHPISLMMPATLCCSYSFMLPIATPPNAIIANAAKFKPTDMMKPGLMMNLLTVCVLLVSFNTFGVLVYDLGDFPSWAEDPPSLRNSSLVLIS